MDRFRIISLIELPRRIFLKSDADLRSNIVVAQKLPPKELKKLKAYDYPIHTEIVRKVGYKLGSGFAIIPAKNPETGVELRDDNNELIRDTDFEGLIKRFKKFHLKYKIYDSPLKQSKIKNDWLGGKISNIENRTDLDLKPRRLTIKALNNIRNIRKEKHCRLGDVADIIETIINLSDEKYTKNEWKLVVGQSIRAVEGTVVPEYPQKSWQIVDEKGATFYPLKNLDVIIGLVRPERRNIGLLIDNSDNCVTSPDGVSVIRLKKGVNYLTQEWLFYVLRQESTRLQFWTESGGTSYGKLSKNNIENVILPIPSNREIKKITEMVGNWVRQTSDSLRSWKALWTEKDKFPIINSPIFGLEPLDF